jgi:flagellar biosynthesis component FlhA
LGLRAGQPSVIIHNSFVIIIICVYTCVHHTKISPHIWQPEQQQQEQEQEQQQQEQQEQQEQQQQVSKYII